MRGAPVERPPSLDPRNLQVLAEETVAPRAGGRQARSESIEGLPAIGLKPLAAEDEASFRAALQPEIYETFEEEDLQDEQVPFLESSFLGMSPTWDARLKGWFDRLSRGLSLLGRGVDRLTPRARPSPPALTMPAPPVRPFAEEPSAPRSVARPAAHVANAIAGAASRGRALFARIRGVAAAGAYRVRGWADRFTRREPTGLWLSSDGPAATPGAAQRKALMPPPNISELPVLRLKADDSESERVDDDIYEGGASFGVAWLWVKRASLIAVLLAGGIVAAGTWETWVPVAARFGRAIVMEIDKRAHQARTGRDEERSQPGGAPLPAAAEQLPHLAPQTITLVLSSSRTGALDPPEVFALAYEAAERGMSALTPAETQELGALRRALHAALSGADRQRLREYDLLRTRRAPLPTENREVLRSFARGARSLPSFARERLQELLGKAIAGALAVPSDAAPRATTAR